MNQPINCTCGKLVGRVRDGKVYVWCKSCKKEVALVDLIEHVEEENHDETVDKR